MSYRPHRYPTVFPIELAAGPGKQSGHLVNITSTGAGLFNITGVANGDAVVIHSSVGRIAATVRWAEQDQCGVSFQQHLGQRQLAQFRHAPTTSAHAHRQLHALTEMR